MKSFFETFAWMILATMAALTVISAVSHHPEPSMNQNIIE